MKTIYTLFLILLGHLIFAQDNKTVSGTIIDDFGDPVEGATIYTSSFEKNDLDQLNQEAIGTYSDDMGRFTLSVPSETERIVVSYVGFNTEIVDITTQTSDLYIVLMDKNEVLSEVVITGYKKIETRKSTSSHKTIEIEEIKQSSAPNVDQMLAGQVTGLTVSTPTGAPGAPAKIQIRGVTTINGSSDPLWVVDGIPLEGNDVPENFDKDNIDNLASYPIAGINPEDIESITVLKDASATSIYGARAANGVIVITTKNGKEGKPSINFAVNTAYTFKPDINKLNLMNADEKVNFELYLASRSDLNYHKERGAVARILNKYGAYQDFQKSGFNSIPSEAQNEINALRNINTNWADELYQNNFNTNYNLSFSGGGKKSDYYLSLGLFDQQGSTKSTGFKRYNITLKNNYRLSERFKIGASLFFNRNINKGYITGADSYTNPSNYLRRTNPYLRLVDDNGDYVYDPDLVERSDLNLNYNLYEERANTSNELISNSIKPMLDASYRFNDQLNIYSQLGLQFDFENTERISNKNSYYTRKYRFRSRYYDPVTNSDRYFMPQGGVIQNWESNLFQYNWKTLLNYNNVFAQNHEIDAMLGTELRRNNRNSIHTKGFGYDDKTFTTIPITHENAIGSSSFRTYDKRYDENAFVSWFSTLSYTYQRKYTLFTSLRYDGSNLFGVDRRYRYLPIWSVAASWNAIEEDFLKNHPFISDLKVRTSYGVQGNIDRSTSPFVVGVFDDTTILPGVNETIIRANGAPNKSLRWERTVSSNVGFDLGLWNNKIYLTADYYRRNSTDLIGLRATPLESGFGFVSANWASLQNSGIELSITTRNISRKDFSWTTSFNISHNKNKITKLQINEEQLKPSLEGYSVNAIFGIKTQGLDANGIPILVKNGEAQSAVNFFNLDVATNGSQLSRAQHRGLYSYIGDGTPLFTGGLSNTLRYKKISLRVSTNFNIAQTVKGAPLFDNTLAEPGYNYNRAIIDPVAGGYPALIGYNSPGLQTDLVYRWFFSGDAGGTYRDLDIWIKKISYLRVNSIRLGYALDSASLEKIGLRNVNLTVEGRNLFVLGSDYTGYFDPETFGSLYAQPLPKSISLGLNMSF